MVPSRRILAWMSRGPGDRLIARRIRSCALWPVVVALGVVFPGCATRTLAPEQVHTTLSTDRNLTRAGLRGAQLAGRDLSHARLRKADLREANLDGADLRGADLQEARLARASLRGAKLAGANLRDADLEKAALSQADLTEAVLAGAALDETQLDHAILTRADLQDASLREANLAGADLREADLTEANLEEATLRSAVLIQARLTEARLGEVNAAAAILDGAYLSRANLEKARLAGASLVGAQLRDAKMRGAQLEQANLTEANLRGADLTGANLRRARLDRAHLAGATLEGADLDGAHVEETDLEGAAFLSPEGQRLITLPPPPTEAQRARIRTLRVVPRSPAPALEIIGPEARSGEVGREALRRAEAGALPGAFILYAGQVFPPLMLLGAGIGALGAAGGAASAAVQAAAAPRPGGPGTVESALAGVTGRVHVEDMLRDRVHEFASQHTPYRILWAADPTSADAVLEVEVTGLRLATGALTVTVRVTLKPSTWSAFFYEANLVHVSPARGLADLAENDGMALRTELDRATRMLGERIVEEAFLRYVP